MSLRDLIAAPLFWAAQRIVGFHESAQRYSPDRGRMPGLDRDAHLDLTQWDVAEQRRKAKYFEANTDLVPAMASVFEQYTVGSSGLRIAAASSSPEYNAIANEILSEWWDFAEINSPRNFSETLSLCAWTWFVQGEVFLLKTFGESYFPRIQVIEPHRVYSDRFGDNDRIIDGIEVNKNGRPIAYHVATGLDASETRRIQAPAIVHICEPSRSGQLRCGPMFSNVMGKLQDLEQIQRNYMRASKISSGLSAIFKTRDKQIPADTARANRMSVSARTNTNVATTENRERNVRAAAGAEILALFPDEEILFPQNNNPTSQQQDFVDRLVAQVCIGAGIPPQLVVPKSLQGTVTRADLDRSAAMFRMRSGVLQKAARNVRNWVMDDAHNYDKRLAGVEIPKDWYKCTVRPPRQVNVDVGRNSSALIAEYSAGFRTLESITMELGEYEDEVIESRAKTARKIQDAAKKYGVTPESISDAIVPQVIQTT